MEEIRLEHMILEIMCTDLCKQSLASPPGLMVQEISCARTNRRTTYTHAEFWKPVLANHDGIWEMGQFRVDHMTMERVYMKLCDSCINRVQ